jgi:hypothetical protein
LSDYGIVLRSSRGGGVAIVIGFSEDIAEKEYWGQKESESEAEAEGGDELSRCEGGGWAEGMSQSMIQ